MQPDLLFTAFSLAIIVFSIILHEVAHGYAANALGDPTAKLSGRLTLNPLPHLDLFGSILIPAFLILSHVGLLFGWAKPVPYNPNNLNKNAFARRWGEFIVAIAGIATNLLLAVLFALIARVALAQGAGVFASAAAEIALVNLSLGFFNLIPIPPLDGFTALRSLLPYRLSAPFRSFQARLQAGGMLGLIVILLLFSYFLSGPFSMFITWIFGVLVGN